MLPVLALVQVDGTMPKSVDDIYSCVPLTVINQIAVTIGILPKTSL
jgi:hypothetical protein